MEQRRPITVSSSLEETGMIYEQLLVMYGSRQRYAGTGETCSECELM